MGKDAIEGNLLQKIRELTRRISALERQQNDVGQLSELSSDMGLQTAGEFRAGNGVEPGEGFSGVRMTADGVSGYDNDVLQSQMSATDGKITAGAGAVVLDNNGINVIGSSTEDPGKIKFINSSGTKLSGIMSWDDGDTVYLENDVYSKTGRGSELLLAAAAPNGYPANIHLYVISGTGSVFSELTMGADGSLYGTNIDASFDSILLSESVTVGTKVIMGDTGALTGGSETINDDAAFSFTPATARGVLIFRSGGANTTIYGMFTYAAVSGTAYCYAWTGAGSAMVAATGALSGTTGTDGKVTVSAHTDGKIYIENRSGGNLNCAWQIVAGV